MKRREFLTILLSGFILALLGKTANAEKKQAPRLKEAMFWKKLD